MDVGIVRSFDNEKGYGFIEANTGDVVFVHHSAIEMEGFRTLNPGQKVTFELVVGKRGPEAKKVRSL